MSGPYCKTCEYYREMPINGAECCDPSKIIYLGKGDRVNSEPIVQEWYECCNHFSVENDVLDIEGLDE